MCGPEVMCANNSQVELGSPNVFLAKSDLNQKTYQFPVHQFIWEPVHIYSGL